MSENNNEQFKMPPKRPRGPMGHGPGMVTEKAKDFKGSTKKLIKYLGRYWAAIIAVMIFLTIICYEKRGLFMLINWVTVRMMVKTIIQYLTIAEMVEAK